MTLVAGLSVGGAPAFIGDLLTCWRLPKKVILPTRADEELHEGTGGDFASGLAQKIVIVRPYLMIVWAGSLSPVRDLVNRLHDSLPYSVDDFVGNEDLLFAPMNVLPEGVEVVALYFDGSTIYPFCVNTRGFELDNKRLYLLGSGREDFFRYVEETPDAIPDVEIQNGLLTRAVLLRFAANVMMSQYRTKYGLSDSWGGGFEVAYTTEKGFEKVDNVLVRAWSINPDGILGNIGVSFLMHYQGAALHLTSFGIRIQTTIVGSLIHGLSDGPARTQVSPEWTIDLFYHVEEGRFFNAVQHDRPGSKSHSVFSFEQNALVGWHMDKSRVDRVLDKIGVALESRSSFSFSALK